MTRKSFEIFLRKASQSFQLIIDDELFRLTNMIENQYIIQLVESSKLATINQVTALTIKTLHFCMKYLEYKSHIKLSKFVSKIDIKKPVFRKICNEYIKSRL